MCSMSLNGTLKDMLFSVLGVFKGRLFTAPCVYAALAKAFFGLKFA